MFALLLPLLILDEKPLFEAKKLYILVDMKFVQRPVVSPKDPKEYFEEGMKVRAFLSRSVQKIFTIDKFQLVLFGMDGDQSRLEKLRTAIDEKSKMFRTIKQAFQDAFDSGSDTIVLVTDIAVSKEVRDMCIDQKPAVRIHVVHLMGLPVSMESQKQAAHELQYLAERNRGCYLCVGGSFLEQLGKK